MTSDMKIFLLPILLLSLFSTHLNADAFTLTTGTLSAGGRVAIPYSYKRNGENRLSFKESPEFGWFIYDNVRLVFSLELEANAYWSRIDPPAAGIFQWGGHVGCEYYFHTGFRVYPYIGLRTGIKINNLQWRNAFALLQAPVGILWPINKYVALTFSAPIEIAFSRDFGFESIDFTPGYFGAIGFF